MIIKLSHIKALMLPVGLFSGVVLYLAYEKWRKKLPPEPLPIQSLDRFARMMEEGSMGERKVTK